MPTFAYRPQANGATERSIQTIMRAVKAFVMGSERKNWDCFAERLTLTMNTARSGTRKETPFYLMHGWDAQSTLTATLPFPSANEGMDAWHWRSTVQQQYIYSQLMVKDLISTAQQRRAENRNNRLPEGANKRINVGDSVWVYIDQVKPGSKKKFDHLWHGPFRVISKPREYASELELKAKRGGTNYRFHSVVHDSRLKRHAEQLVKPVDRPGAMEGDELSEEFLLASDEGMQTLCKVESIDDVQERTTATGEVQLWYRVRVRGRAQYEWVPRSMIDDTTLIYRFEAMQDRLHRLQEVEHTDISAQEEEV
jgi:hypothetical protein